MTTILGLNAFHGDAAACLVRDGRIVAAAEEERFRRVKHWAGFPSEAIRHCLADAGMVLADVDHVAVNQDSKAHLGRKLAYAVTRRPDLALVLDRLRNRREREGVESQLARAFPGEPFRGRVHAVEHHVAHLSSAFHASPFDEAAVVSVDGFGDFASAAWGVGRNVGIEVSDRVYFPHSLGIFYQALTQFVGFPNYGDEYKMMGLAPHGEPTHLDAMRRIVLLDEGGGFRLNLDCFRHHREKIEYEWDERLADRRRAVFGASGRAAGTAPRRRRAARAAPHGHRALGAGHVRGGLLPSARGAAPALRARCARHRRGLREQLGGQWQGDVDDALPRRSTSRRRRAMPAEPWAPPGRSGTLWAGVALRRCAMRTGGRSSTTRRSAGCSSAGARTWLPRAAPSSASTTTTRSVAAPRPRSPLAAWSDGFRGAWNGDRARWATARFSATRAAPT